MSNDQQKAIPKPKSRIILASGSPRRKELLSQIGVDFEIIVPEVSELSRHPDGPTALVLENARIKAGAVSFLKDDRWVLGADTIVALGGTVLGKPVNLDDARTTFRRLSGRTHQVHTAICLIHRSKNLEIAEVITSSVTFKKLDSSAIESYFRLVNPLDKAGGYAMQTNPGLIIDHFEGSQSNVIGLPLEEVEKLLNRFGLL